MDGVDIARLRLAAVTGVTDVVSTRIYRMMLPQAPTLPAICVKQVVASDDLHLRGLVGVRVERVQIDFVASLDGDGLSDLIAAADAAQAIDGSGFAGWSGSIGSPATRVDRIQPLERTEAFQADELEQQIVSQDYYVQYRASA